MRSKRVSRPVARTALRLIALACVVAVLAPTQASADAFTSPATGTHQVVGAILQRYQAAGGPAGVHRFPVTDELGTPDGRGRFTVFQRGSIYWTPTTGAHSIYGSILGRWARLGWETSFLGYPVTDELGTPDGRGRYNAFERGAVYWTPTTDAHAVQGAILQRWGQLGWETSVLGYPVTDELTTPNLQGRFNAFERGSIYWSPASGAHAVYGAIRIYWGQLGWENSALGFPTSDEYSIPGGRAQDFQYGSIGWTPGGGAFLRGTGTTGGQPLPLGVSPAGSQLVTVVAAPGATRGTLTAWERGANGWYPVLGPMPAYLGSAGIGVASETTARTPAGTWRLSEAFGRQGNPGTTLPYRVVDGADWWVSDVRSPLYNAYARCARGSCPFDERAAENLYAAGAVYDRAVVIDYNRPGVAGAGSAFFLHITNGAATAGCVAIDRGSLETLMRWLRPGAAPVISIGLG